MNTGSIGQTFGLIAGIPRWLNSSQATATSLGHSLEMLLGSHLFRRTVHGRAVSSLLCVLGYHWAGRGKKAPTVNAQFLKFLDDYLDRPFFAYLCYMDVNQSYLNRMYNHGFWVPAPPVQEVVRAYEQGLTRLDGAIGDLFAVLEQRALLENTLVVITSDHGQSFGAENANDHDPSGHGTSLYPEQTRVPLFLIYPNRLGTVQKVISTVSHRQIPATITHLMGLGNSTFPGDPLPIQDSPSQNYGAPVLTTLNNKDRRMQSVIWNGWQYIINLNKANGNEELYDLAPDPFAKKNLTTAHPLVTPVRAVLQQLLARGSESPPVGLVNPARRGHGN
jgi:arylsulfatase A-like enzyme